MIDWADQEPDGGLRETARSHESRLQSRERGLLHEECSVPRWVEPFGPARGESSVIASVLP